MTRAPYDVHMIAGEFKVSDSFGMHTVSRLIGSYNCTAFWVIVMSFVNLSKIEPAYCIWSFLCLCTIYEKKVSLAICTSPLWLFYTIISIYMSNTCDCLILILFLVSLIYNLRSYLCWIFPLSVFYYITPAVVYSILNGVLVQRFSCICMAKYVFVRGCVPVCKTWPNHFLERNVGIQLNACMFLCTREKSVHFQLAFTCFMCMFFNVHAHLSKIV